MYAGMIGLHGLPLSADMRWQFGGMELAALGFALLAVYAGPWLVRVSAPAPRTAAAGSRAAPAGLRAAAAGLPVPDSSGLALAGRLAVVPLFVLALLRTAAVSFTPFLYFKF